MRELKQCPMSTERAAEKLQESFDYMSSVMPAERRRPATAELLNAIAVAISTLRAQPDNAPLTLEELRGMDGEPVYSQKEELWVMITINEYGPVLVFKDGSRCFAADWLDADCGPLYRRKPEPEGGDR